MIVVHLKSLIVSSMASLGRLLQWRYYQSLAVVACAAVCASGLVARAEAKHPNIVIILADDLGWADAGCYGNTFNETPRIDRMAEEGMRFTQFYAGPVCSPTRVNLQSGLDQARFGITQHIPGHRRPFARLIDPQVPRHLPLEVETFAEALKQAGYATGYFGKWHLGGGDHGPENQGWDESFVSTGNDLPPRRTGRNEPVRAADYLTDLTLDFIESHRDRPFLAFLSHYAVHIPLSTTPDLLAKYRSKEPMEGYPSRPKYAGLLEELDHSVGRVLDAIDQADIARETLILFVSDNGGLEHEQNGTVVTSNQPLRSEKGTLYEGGVRVPAIARWTGHVPAGSICDVPAITHDVFPTLLDVAAIDLASRELDGVSLLPLLTGDAQELQRESLYWHLPHYHHSTPASAIRNGDWKLIEFFEGDSLELYNLRTDLGEQNNLASSEPERASQMRASLQQWRERVGARMPKPNPDYDPDRADELGRRNRGGN